MTNPRVAIITGGSSGIGLALTTHLVSQGWTTVIADLQTPPDTILGPFIHYHHTDVSSYASLKSLFSFAFSLYSRVDFVALNAGIDDRDDIFNSINLEGDVNAAAPAEPDMRTFETNLFGVYYGIKLFAHYHARNSLLTDQDGEKGGKNRVGKIIITASNVGLYPMPAAPQYCAAKHALIGLTRSLAPKAAKQGITINAVCPAIVETSIMPPLLKENIPAEIMTPMSTVIRAFEALLADGEGDGACGVAG
ncbi:NAD(P)-binding protein [Patellaria atrata CBS 101060]|uniref:NAD(P)-binding protein n=1 Tax=Patellaria atrata CBS 101060 TaxID=1346257 RepID=A0A9P4S7M7_9PEZI|nr:NAD(P)-binding protein [Patellaria atrata CBS 101060]